MQKVVKEFNEKVPDKIASYKYVTQRDLDEWNFEASKNTAKVIELLIQMYQRQHQPIPISRDASFDEKEWEPSDEGEYKGHTKNGVKHGHGSFKYKDGSRYDGEWKENRKHGLGVQVWIIPDKKYEGDWEDGKQRGYGTCIESATGKIYHGQWDDDKRHGWGRETWTKSSPNYGEVYEGEWEDNKRRGFCSHVAKDGDKYIGEWYQETDTDLRALGYPHGHGRLTCNKYKYVYEGEFKKGIRHGYGKIIEENGDTYEGEWVADKKDGHGTFIPADFKHTKTPKTTVMYVGHWKVNRREGKGVSTCADGTVYDGDWFNNKKHGKGVEMDPKGNKFEGHWVEDKRDGEGTLHKNGKTVKQHYHDGVLQHQLWPF